MSMQKSGSSGVKTWPRQISWPRPEHGRYKADPCLSRPAAQLCSAGSTRLFYCCPPPPIPDRFDTCTGRPGHGCGMLRCLGDAPKQAKRIHCADAGATSSCEQAASGARPAAAGGRGCRTHACRWAPPSTASRGRGQGAAGPDQGADGKASGKAAMIEQMVLGQSAASVT